jgi:predicted N-acetyltransferase YhbS
MLGRLAVDSGYQGKGYGDLLVADALKRSLALSKQLASFAVVVDAIEREVHRDLHQLKRKMLRWLDPV